MDDSGGPSDVMAKIYSIPASAWGLFAGALGGLAFNVVMIARFEPTREIQTYELWLLFLLFLASACSFGWLSALLEDLRRAGDASQFRIALEVPRQRRMLRTALFTGVVTMCAALVALIEL